MHQETSYELFIGDGYNTSGLPRRSRPGGKDSIRFTDGQDPAVGDGDLMRILSKIFDSVAKSVEGLLDIRAPVHPVKSVLKILPPGVCLEAEKGLREREAAFMEQGIKESKEFSFEFIAQDKDRDEEVCGGPADCVVRSQTAAGDNTMHMHMVPQLLVPRMEHLDNAWECSKELWIGGKLQKGFGTASVEEAV